MHLFASEEYANIVFVCGYSNGNAAQKVTRILILNISYSLLIIINIYNR